MILHRIAEKLWVRHRLRQNRADLARFQARLARSAAFVAQSPRRRHQLVVRLHPFAGFGHQISGWISGVLWARDLGMSVSLAKEEASIAGLLDLPLSRPEATRRTWRLPAVRDERTAGSVEVLRSVVAQAEAKNPGKDLTFELALDQARWDQTPADADVRRSYIAGNEYQRYAAMSARSPQRNPYIAMHIRRGDVSAEDSERWVTEDWYLAILRRLRRRDDLAQLEVRAYAIGSKYDFPGLEQAGVELHLDGSRNEDFSALAQARLLVAAPSSFSFTAALASTAPVIARSPWWHAIPESGRWVQADHSGAFDDGDLSRAMAFAKQSLDR